jgi:hypothetical protein
MSALPPRLNARARAWAWWLIPAVALLALIGWEIDWGRHVLRSPPPAAPVEPKPVTASVLPEYRIDGGLPGHGETVERTLFNATRRPAPALAADSGPGRLTVSQFVLMGTTVTGDKNIAFLKEVAGGKSRVVKQGDQINGMLVASVEKDRVRFTLNDESDELFLKVAAGPKTTLAAAPPQMPGAVPAAADTGQQGRPPVANRAQAAAAQAAQAPQQQNQGDVRSQRRAARQAGQGAASGDASGQGNAGGNQGGRRRQ